MQDDNENTQELFRAPTGRALPRKSSPLGQQPKKELPPIIEGAEYKVVNGQLTLVKAPKKQASKPLPELKITPGLFKSLDGRKIRVWYVNKNSMKFPVVGAIETNGVWEPRVWNTQGWTKEPFGQVNNIIAAWSEL